MRLQFTVTLFALLCKAFTTSWNSICFTNSVSPDLKVCSLRTTFWTWMSRSECPGFRMGPTRSKHQGDACWMNTWMHTCTSEESLYGGGYIETGPTLLNQVLSALSSFSLKNVWKFQKRFEILKLIGLSVKGQSKEAKYLMSTKAAQILLKIVSHYFITSSFIPLFNHFPTLTVSWKICQM